MSIFLASTLGAPTTTIAVASGAAVGVLAALLGGGGVARFAAKRTVRQPSNVEIAAERRVLAAVLEHPEWYPAVSSLTPEMFLDPACRMGWGCIQQAVLEFCGEPLVAASARAIPVVGARMPADLRERMQLPEGVVLPDLATDAKGRPLCLRSFLAAGQAVFDGEEGRTLYAGSSTLSVGGVGEPPLVRRFAEPSRNRRRVTTGMLATVAALAPWLAVATLGGAWPVGVVAVWFLAVVCTVLSLVDVDTLFLDLPVFWWGAAGSAVLAAGAAAVAGSPVWALWGLGIAVVLGVAFEALNLLYRLVRGRHGIGGGDSLVLLLTAGVPVALTGLPMLGLYTVLAGMVTSLGGWGVAALRGKVTKNTPLPMVPFLSAGWIVAWVAVTLHGGSL